MKVIRIRSSLILIFSLMAVYMYLSSRGQNDNCERSASCYSKNPREEGANLLKKHLAQDYQGMIFKRITQRPSDNRSGILNMDDNLSSEKDEMSAFLEEQQRRRKHYESVCAERKIVSRGRTYIGLIVNRKDNLTWCQIFKSASSTLDTLMLKVAGEYQEDVHLQVQIRKSFTVISNQRALPLSENTIRLIVVRHPYERLVSCYRYALENINRPEFYLSKGENIVRLFRETGKHYPIDKREQLLKEIRNIVSKDDHGLIDLPNNPYANPPGPTFIEFIRFVVNPSLKQELHWVPYVTVCYLCKSHFDFIIRLENIDEEMKLFLKYKGGGAERVPIETKNSLQSKPTMLQTVKDYMSQLDHKLFEQLKQTYLDDLLLFDFDPDLYAPDNI